MVHDISLHDFLENKRGSLVEGPQFNMVGESGDQTPIFEEDDHPSAITIVLASKQPVHRRSSLTPSHAPSHGDEHWEDRIVNGACGSARHSLALPHEDALPFQTDLDRETNALGPDENLPSPVIPGPSPPDGGLRAWMVMLASFLCNGIIFGTINSSGVIFVALKAMLEEEGISSPASLASITLSLAIGTTFFLSMVAGVLTDKLGIRVTTIAGGAIATLGMFLSSIYYTESNILIVTMGLLFGTGASLAYTPSLVILGHYFYKRLGLVNGFVTAGSSVFTIIITELLKLVLDKHGLKTAFQMLSGLMAVLVICGFIFKPLLPDMPPPNETWPEKQKKSLANSCRKFFALFINFEIWKNKRYVIWILAIPSALFGYFVPYVHLVAYVKDVLGKDVNSQILVQCIGATSGLGRIVFGLIADRPWVNRIVLQQISFFCIGVLTMLLTGARAFWMFIVISLGMGLFDGCFISLLGPIAFDIVGPAGASQAIGALLAFCSIPLTLGPYVAGVMYDHLGSYMIPFLCAGIPPILGGFALFFMRCFKEPEKGCVGSPVRDSTEMKNNVAVANPGGVPEAQALMPPDNNSNGELLQVDVRHLVNLQRESSV